MNNLKKLFVISALVLGVAFIVPLSTSASTGDESEFFKERIKGIEFDIPYAESEVYVEKSIEGLVGKIKVFDNETNELLDIFEVEDEVQAKTKISTLSSGHTTLKDIRRSRIDNGLATGLRARVEIYSYGSFRQINRVVETRWFTGSGFHTIENSSASSVSKSGKYPTTSIEILGDANIQIVTTQSFSAGWEAAGFTVDGSIGGENYFRKYISMGFNYSVY